jgi:hypothetical protein
VTRASGYRDPCAPLERPRRPWATPATRQVTPRPRDQRARAEARRRAYLAQLAATRPLGEPSWAWSPSLLDFGVMVGAFLTLLATLR